MQTPDEKERAVIFHRSQAWTDAGSRGYELLVEDGRLQLALIHFWPGNAIAIKTRDKIPPRQWLHVTATYDGSSRAGDLRCSLTANERDCDIVRDNLFKNITGGGGDTITIGARFRDHGFAGGRVDEFYVFDRQLTQLEVRRLRDGRLPQPPRPVLSLPFGGGDGSANCTSCPGERGMLCLLSMGGRDERPAPRKPGERGRWQLQLRRKGAALFVLLGHARPSVPSTAERTTSTSTTLSGRWIRRRKSW